MTTRSLVFWRIEECSAYFDRLRLRGWCHVPEREIVAVEVIFDDFDGAFPVQSFGLPSPDVNACCGPGADHARFDEWLSVPANALGQPFTLRCRLRDGSCAVGHDALTNAAQGDAYYQSWENFLTLLEEMPSGAVLELGSRARSAITRRHRISRRFEYVGLDIVPGPNVDCVGDAHELSRIFDSGRFVAVFSFSVFEHLAMPWKVALEVNRVLARGGLVYTATHQTWPAHEEPHDFWRFSQHAWQMLFNFHTGFKIVEAVVGEPARVHACRTSPVTREMHLSRAWLGSAAIARKIRDTRLTWPVAASEILASHYPSGEAASPPTADPT